MGFGGRIRGTLVAAPRLTKQRKNENECSYS